MGFYSKDPDNFNVTKVIFFLILTQKTYELPQLLSCAATEDSDADMFICCAFYVYPRMDPMFL